MSDWAPPPRRDPQQSGVGRIVGGFGAAVLVIICCAAPILLAAGVLGAVGAWLSSPWVIAAAVALIGSAVIATVAQRRASRANRPAAGSSDPDKPADPSATEHPHQR